MRCWVGARRRDVRPSRLPYLPYGSHLVCFFVPTDTEIAIVAFRPRLLVVPVVVQLQLQRLHARCSSSQSRQSLLASGASARRMRFCSTRPPGPAPAPAPIATPSWATPAYSPVPSGTPPHGNGRAIRAPGRRGRRAANQSSSAPLVFDADVARGTTRPPCTRGLGGRVLFFAVTRGLDSAGCLRRLRLATAAAAGDDPRRVEQRSANLARRHPRGRQMTFDV